MGRTDGSLLSQHMLPIYVGLIAVAAIWGANFAVSRWAMDSFSPVQFSIIRFGGAVPIFFFVLLWREGNVGIAWRDAGKLVLIGFFGVAVLEIAVMYSIKYTSLANASLLNVAPWPIFAALFAPLFTKERITARLLTGGGMAMVGVCLIILGGEERFDFSPTRMVGNLLAFGVSICGALFNLACMPLMKRYSALRVSTWYCLFGSLFIFPLTLGTWGKVSWTSLDSAVWGAIIYNIVVCTVIAFIVWNHCMLKAGAAKSNFFRYVVPVAAVFVGYLFFHETIQVGQMLGGLLIAAGLVWIVLENKSANHKIPS